MTHNFMLSLLTLGSRWTFVGGKGGVGKTTVSAALAVELAEAGRPILVLSVDPAHSLGDALGVALGPEPSPVPGVAGLLALEVDRRREEERFLGANREYLVRLLDRGTYLDRSDVGGLVELTLPGADELAALFRLLDLAADPHHQLVVDTAPTGHALRLLELPELALGWLDALDAMEEKHRAVSLALAGAYEPDEAARLLVTLRDDLRRLHALLRDPELTRFVLVTNPEPVVLAETRRYEAALTGRGIALGGIVVNRADARAEGEAVGRGMVFVPRLPREPRGVAGLRAFAAAAARSPGSSPVAAAPPAEARRAAGAPFPVPPGRSLYLVGGKGGVGKSTAAAALAIQLADGGRHVLLLGADPAGSLGELLGVDVGGEARAVPGAAGLRARQLDAESAWREFRSGYRAEAERLLAGITAGGGSGAADARVVERLIDLAPPGLDELMTLVQVVDLTGDRPYDALVLDTAPTGHLLRLLELPDVALGWARELLRLLLKYREVTGLGELAERVLGLARELRGLRGRLRDPGECWFLAVALPEALAVPETGRLLHGLRELGIEPGALLVNRLLDDAGGVRAGAAERAAELVELALDLPVAAAPDLERPPIGPEALRAFAGAWRELGS